MLKSSLQELYKKKMSRAFHQNLLKNYISDPNKYKSNSEEVEERNITEYTHMIKKCISIINGENSSEFHVFFETHLPYTSQIACQTLICLEKDIDGTIINDVYNMDKNYNLEDICVCIYPLEQSTLIIGFCLQESKERYDNFFRNFNNQKYNDKIKLLQSIIFSHTEEVYLTKEIHKLILSDKKFENTRNQGIPVSQLINETLFQFTPYININDFLKQTNYITKPQKKG
ncbi:MAG: hypothetical protein K9L64_06890 [Candidatus Izimaplasma sp.]|nr:hypothetical protein [Candidatus Izimaplasma bacterium]